MKLVLIYDCLFEKKTIIKTESSDKKILSAKSKLIEIILKCIHK